MKWLLVLSSVLVAFSNAQNTCYDDSIQGCAPQIASDDLKNCNAIFSGFPTPKGVEMLQKYANHQIEKSFEYLLLAANFGTFTKNRPGFEKQFRSLADKSWNNGIELIKHITKRGGSHNFAVTSNNKTEKKSLDLNEMQSLALALDYEKTLSLEAHHVHERYSRAKFPHEYDPEIAHFIEEDFIEGQASTIRKLSGYTNDLKKLIKSDNVNDVSLALYLFDEYLAKE